MWLILKLKARWCLPLCPSLPLVEGERRGEGLKLLETKLGLILGYFSKYGENAGLKQRVGCFKLKLPNLEKGKSIPL